MTGGREQDPHNSRWKISQHAVDELVSASPSPEGPTEEFLEQSTELIQELVEVIGAALSAVTASDAGGFSEHRGYGQAVQVL